MKVKLKFFASWREIINQGEMDWPIKEGQNVQDVLTGLIAEYPALAAAAPNSLVMVNRRYADRQAALQSGDEVAFIPPIGGGTK